jgi:hypothetical protein
VVDGGKRKTKTCITKEIKKELLNTTTNRARTKTIRYMDDDKQTEPAMFPIIDDTSFGNGGMDETVAEEVLPVVEKNVGTRRSTRHAAGKLKDFIGLPDIH